MKDSKDNVIIYTLVSAEFVRNLDPRNHNQFQSLFNFNALADLLTKQSAAKTFRIGRSEQDVIDLENEHPHWVGKILIKLSVPSNALTDVPKLSTYNGKEFYKLKQGTQISAKQIESVRPMKFEEYGHTIKADVDHKTFWPQDCVIENTGDNGPYNPADWAIEHRGINHSYIPAAFSGKPAQYYEQLSVLFKSLDPKNPLRLSEIPFDGNRRMYFKDLCESLHLAELFKTIPIQNSANPSSYFKTLADSQKQSLSSSVSAFFVGLSPMKTDNTIDNLMFDFEPIQYE